MTANKARLDVLERDIRTLLADARSGGNAEQLVIEVVTDSDFVTEDEQTAVEREMLDRIEGQ